MGTIKDFEKRIHYERLMEKLLSMSHEEQESDAGLSLLMDAFSIAPPEIKQIVDNKLRELGLLPEPEFCDDTGAVFYSIDSVAEKLGISAREIEAECRRNADPSFQPVGQIHRLQ